MMHKASLASYAVGIFAIVSSLTSSIVTSSLMNPIDAAIASGTVTSATLAQLTQVMNMILPLTLITLLITLLLAIVFAYFNLAVGSAYNMGVLKLAVISYVIVNIATIPVTLAVYTLLPILSQLLANPSNASAIVSQALGTILLVGLAAILIIVFLLVFVIGFLVSLNRMQRETGISLFRTAMYLGIIGIVLYFLNSVFSAVGIPFSIGDLLLQITIILFGLGLSKAAKEGRVPKSLGDRATATQA
jgi:hypothetical protein